MSVSTSAGSRGPDRLQPTSGMKRNAIILLWSIAVLLGAAGILFMALSASVRIEADWAPRGASAIPILPFATVGALIALRNPENRIGWLCLAVGVLSGVQAFVDEYPIYALIQGDGIRSLGVFLSWMQEWVWIPVMVLVGNFLFLMFPSGKLSGRRWKPVLGLGMVCGLAAAVAVALSPGRVGTAAVRNPIATASADVLNAIFGFGFIGVALSLAFAAISLIGRWRRSQGEERLQLKWFAFAALLAALIVMVSPLLAPWGGLVTMLALSFLPIAIGIAVLKYRLYDIDIVISKTIVFGLLAIFITTVYVAIVVGIGSALGSTEEPNIALSIAATAVVAIAFSPVKDRTQRLANRLVYGHRTSPYEVLTELSRTVAAAESPEEVLDAVVRAAVAGTGSAAAEVTLLFEEGGSLTRAFPDDEQIEGTSATQAFRVEHEGQRIGSISVVKRRGDPFTPADLALMSDLTAQASLALHNARLALALKARLEDISHQARELDSSRTRIVSAADDTKRRLERDITGGPRRDLEAIQQGLRRARTLMATDGKQAATVLEGLTVEANDTLDALRELARGVYPPLLADKGLIPALESHIRKREVPVQLTYGKDLAEARFEESEETTVYFCCVEALASANEGTQLDIRMSNDRLVAGFERVVVPDYALQAIADRVGALNGSLAASPAERSLQVELRVRSVELAP